MESDDVTEVEIGGLDDDVDVWLEPHLEVKYFTRIVNSLIQPQTVARKRDRVAGEGVEFVVGAEDNGFRLPSIYMEKIYVLLVLDVRQVKMVCELEGNLEVMVFTSTCYLCPS